MRRKGFTLIELLIVVAIIGILAAIAIPNFLAAQVRAKVARAKSEMKTLQTAAETYLVDCNMYPRNTSEPPYSTMGDGGGPLWGSGYCSPDFTTPIAYIKKAALRDPFNDVPGLSSTPEDEIIYSYHTIGPNRAWTDTTGKFRNVYGKYRFTSYGPDRNYWNNPTNTASRTQRIIYDPTNGTVSQGNIFISQKAGIMTKEPLESDLY
ncbi:MAG TPA: prepilin-type N-terminal cleavage/methylation domain-containing protein [bacterium]|nr:prepilin-type N-terminal cleavage/methylation domain-containing protein [bacterium]